MASMKLPNFQEPRTPIPLSIYVQHFFHPLGLGRPVLNKHPTTLSNKRNQNKNKTKSRLIDQAFYCSI